MLKRHLACSCLAVALLFAMAGTVRADVGCARGGQSVGIPKIVASMQAEPDSAVAPDPGGGAVAEPGRSPDEPVVTSPAAGESWSSDAGSVPDESIGTGTMAGDAENKGIPAFGGNTWDAILGISPGPEYNGPMREGPEP